MSFLGVTQKYNGHKMRIWTASHLILNFGTHENLLGKFKYR